MGRADNVPRFVQSRHEEMSRLRRRRVRQVQRPGRRLHGHLGTRGHPPAQRPLRRQARPRPGGGDRRARRPAARMGGSYQQEVDLADAVQGRRQRIPGRRSTSPSSCRTRSTGPSAPPRRPARRPAVIIPSDLQEEEYAAPEHAFKQVPSSPPGTARAHAVASEYDIARAADVTQRGGAARRPGRAGRARRAPSRSGGWPTSPARGWPRRCWARTCCPTTCPMSPAPSGCSAPGPATR